MSDPTQPSDEDKVLIQAIRESYGPAGDDPSHAPRFDEELQRRLASHQAARRRAPLGAVAAAALALLAVGTWSRAPLVTAPAAAPASSSPTASAALEELVTIPGGATESSGCIEVRVELGEGASAIVKALSHDELGPRFVTGSDTRFCIDTAGLTHLLTIVDDAERCYDATSLVRGGVDTPSGGSCADAPGACTQVVLEPKEIPCPPAVADAIDLDFADAGKLDADGASESDLAPGPPPAQDNVANDAPAPASGDDSFQRPRDLQARPQDGLGEMAVAPSTRDDAPSASNAATCDNLYSLEPAAMMGRLSEGQRACLEAALAQSPARTEQDKLSRVLMADSWAKGDKHTWERLVRRHLETIDDTDPNLCVKYALYLSKQGASRALEAIRWAEAAIENHDRWTGDTYVSRLDRAYTIRAVAGRSRWLKAEEAYAERPTTERGEAVEETRLSTRRYAQEWLAYRRQAGKDLERPLALCLATGASPNECEGQ